MFVSKATLLALVPFLLELPATTSAQVSGTGTTTRYWDCCKPSCSWPGKLSLASGATPPRICDINDNPLTDFNTKSACQSGGGTSYMCSNESPWAVNDNLAYGYAAVSIAGGTEASWCCACYALTFTSGPVAGKTLVVQATNTGGDLGSNQFDLAMPGGGFGIFDACTAEWGTPSTGWGATYGGISTRSQCDAFPAALQAGCYWRFDWFMGADNPTVSFKQVTCPLALTSKTGCVRNGEVPTNDPVPSSATQVRTSTTTPLPIPTTTARTTSLIRTTNTVRTTTRASTTAAGGNSGGSSGGTAPQWGQCGGNGWTGPTTCAAPYRCVYSNDWYSQCLT